MAMPPVDISPKNLWAKINERPRPHKIVDFPRVGDDGKPIGQLAIWVLTQEEQVAANAEAEKFARKLLKEAKRGDIGYESIFDNEGSVQVIWRACRDPDDVRKPAFPSPEAIRSAFTADEVGALFENYVTVQVMLGPNITELSDDEYEAWVHKLDQGQAFFFDRLSSAMKTTLALFMARRLVTYWTESSSAGSPPEDAVPEAEETSVSE